MKPTLILTDTIVPPEDGKIYGIHTATQEWLKAYIRHAQPAEIMFRAQKNDQEQTLAALAAASPTPITLKKSQNAHDVPHCAVYVQLPDAGHFWLRQWPSPKAYSICGLNHSLCGSHIYDQLRNIFLAPTEKWDALICASHASHAVINAFMDSWSDYLASRGGGAPTSLRPPLRLPVIPMGTDTAMWADSASTRKLGQDLRDRLGIGKEDVVSLFLGRLNFSSKAHPYPMLQALQEAQAQSKNKLHLLLAGWFPGPEIEQETRKLEAALAPDIRIHHLPASNNTERLSAYAAADIFISLSDNIQESFGLTLVEAMACGLPVIASDWDGYRDTIAHGETGFLVPTLMAPPGSGADIGLAHGLGMRIYNRYLVDAAQATAISANAARDAILRLVAEPDLRRRLGEAGRKRAATLFDWGPIVKAHQALWEELEQARKNGTPVHTKPGPQHPDPFTLFREFATGRIQPDTPLNLTKDWQKLLTISVGSILMRSSSDMLVDEAGQAALIQALQTTPGLAAGKLIEVGPFPHDRALRSLMWLIKAGIVRPGGINGF